MIVFWVLIKKNNAVLPTYQIISYISYIKHSLNFKTHCRKVWY